MPSHGKLAADFGRRHGAKIMPNAARLEKNEIVETLLPAMRRAANNNLKLLALLGDVGPETAKNWIEGRNLPGLSTFINMARICPELRAEVFRLMDPEAEFDPDFLAACAQLARAAAKKFDS